VLVAHRGRRANKGSQDRRESVVIWGQRDPLVHRVSKETLVPLEPQVFKVLKGIKGI
jgi:hypothetical protein